MMIITLDRTSRQPIYRQLAEDIQRRISSGALPPGSRLPTVRELARQLSVTRLTVHNAYSELQSGGWVEATIGRGTFVAERLENDTALASLGQEMSARGVINDAMRMAQLPGMRSLAMADAAAELHPAREFGRALETTLASNSSAALSYTPSQGDPLLRTALVNVLRERNVGASPDEIMVTSGVTQGLALLARTLARPGDAVLVEQPTYMGALNVLGANGLRLVGVPVDDEGMSVERIDALIQTHHPRFIYVIPAFQNPTGVCMSAARRAALLAAAARHSVPLVEDDIYAALCYEGSTPPALKTSDTHGVVIYLSSLSKSMMPGVRLGYIVAPPQYLGALVAAKQADDLCSPALLQRAMAHFLHQGGLQSHLRRALPRYRERRDTMLDAMAKFFPSGVQWNAPRGGFSVWATLPAGMSSTDVYLAAIERGVAFTPGEVFFAGPAPYGALRLAFSAQPPPIITETIQVIGELLGNHATRRMFASAPIADYVPLV